MTIIMPRHSRCEDCDTAGPRVTLCQGDLVLCPDCDGKRRAASAAKRSAVTRIGQSVQTYVMTPLRKLRDSLFVDLDDSLDQLMAGMSSQPEHTPTTPTADGAGAEEISSPERSQTIPMESDKESRAAEEKPASTTNAAPKGKRIKKSKKDRASHCVPGCTQRSSELVRCCLCIKWFHPACVGDSDVDAGAGFWNCMDCRKLPQHVSQMSASLEKLRSEVQSVRQLQTSYSKLQASLDAQQKTNQQLVNLLAAKTAECQELRQLASTAVDCEDQSVPVNTTPQPKPARTGSLLLGDSILRDVDANRLPGTSVVYRGGACINDARQQLMKDGRQYDTVVLHVGTNDLPGCLEADDVISDYRELVEEAKTVANNVVLSSVCPRSDFPDLMDKLDAVNAGLLDLSDGLDCVFVDHNNHFRTRDGGINDAVLHDDGLHLSRYGTNKLISHLGLETTASDITKQDTGRRSKRSKPDSGRQRNNPAQKQDYRSTSARNHSGVRKMDSGVGGCYKCGLRNHATEDCRHKSRVKCYSCGRLGHKNYNCQSSG